MTIRALDLCRERGIPFGQTFDQQWLLSRARHDIPDFARHELGGWHLHSGPTLPVAVAADPARGWQTAMLGQAVDPDGAYVDDGVLAAHLTAAATPQDLCRVLEHCGGRFAFLVTAPGCRRLYLDPSGCLGAVYDADTRTVGASLFMVLEREVEPFTDYPPFALAASGQGGRFAFGATPDRHVRRLLCNHYLDLDSFTETRHWPTEDDDLDCPRTVAAVEQRVETAILRNRQILRAITARATPAMLPLTGGADARLLLAFAKPFLDQIDHCFTHRTNFNTSVDSEIAGQLAARMGVECRLYDVIEDKSLRRRRRFIDRMIARQQLSLGLLDGTYTEPHVDIMARHAIPLGGTVLRGNVTDLSKAVLWRGRGIREFLYSGGERHDLRTGVHLMKLGQTSFRDYPWILDRYERWVATLPACARGRILDFSSLEHFRTHGQGAFFYMCNRNFYTTPSADRTVLRAFISLPPDIRDAFYINDMMVERAAPELLDLPYTRARDNALRDARPPLAEALAHPGGWGDRLPPRARARIRTRAAGG